MVSDLLFAYFFFSFGDGNGLQHHRNTEQILRTMKTDQILINLWGPNLVGMVSPLLLASCLCSLFLTSSSLSSYPFRNKGSLKKRNSANHHNHVCKNGWRGVVSWFVTKIMRRIMEVAQYGHDLACRRHKVTGIVNQFGRGTPNFNVLAFGISFLPIAYLWIAFTPSYIQYANGYAQQEGLNLMRVQNEWLAYHFGWMSTISLVFFLIPVTRHSILLSAMGWSPIHALRIHIWSGSMAFWFMLLHGVMIICGWFLWRDEDDFPVYRQIIPDRKCWTLTWTNTWDDAGHFRPNCYRVYCNITGLFSLICFMILGISSLNWVRRRNYRLFYIFHISFGSLTLFGIIMHMPWFAVYLIPSLIYYLASTTPVVIQALASHFRGGVKIRKVVLIGESGGCVEVHVDAERNVQAILEREPCQFMKLCVPKISLIWHPFDVYKHYSVDGTPDDSVRFLFRPVGSFTGELAKQLTTNVLQKRPVLLMDGFYHGSDKTELAMQHDCVTIVAGGTAITPYLSLIPSILNRIALSERAGQATTIKTKSIVLHWSSRESGLCRYYVENYLNTFVMRAKALNLDTSLSIYVYQTGSKGLDPNYMPETKAVDGHYDEESKIVRADSTVVVGAHNEGKSYSDSHDGTKTADNRHGGHPLELARMLPRRYSSPIWNVPAFVFFSMTSCFGFWYIVSRSEKVNYLSYSNLAMMTWISLSTVPTYMAFGILCEACVFGLRKYWPQPIPEEYEIVTLNCKKECIKDVIMVDQDLGKATLIYRKGRPDGEQILEDACKAAEPGIFMCGPSSLTHMVKAEASKENSCLGRTRFCLYDEPYEM